MVIYTLICVDVASEILVSKHGWLWPDLFTLSAQSRQRAKLELPTRNVLLSFASIIYVSCKTLSLSAITSREWRLWFESVSAVHWLRGRGEELSNRKFNILLFNWQRSAFNSFNVIRVSFNSLHFLCIDLLAIQVDILLIEAAHVWIALRVCWLAR